MVRMEPPVGVEPTTYRLQGDCSAIEPRRHILLIGSPSRERSGIFGLKARFPDQLEDGTMGVG